MTESLVSCLGCAEAAAPEFAAAPEKEERLGAGGGAGHALAGQQVLAAAVRARGADPAWGSHSQERSSILISIF